MPEKAKLKKAYELGVRAFQKGWRRVPAFDEEYLETVVRGLEVGEGIPYHKEWIKGWDDENLRDL